MQVRGGTDSSHIYMADKSSRLMSIDFDAHVGVQFECFLTLDVATEISISATS